MFNSTTKFDIRIFSGGPKACTVSWPPDEAWKKRSTAMRLLQESAGRGKTETIVQGLERASKEMFDKIRVDQDGPAFDAAEAAEVIGKLEYVELQPGDSGQAVEFDGNVIRVTIGAVTPVRGATPYSGLVHVLRAPTQRQIMDYRRDSVRIINGRRSSEVSYSLEAGERLYDALYQSAEGYETPVPVIHKDFVVTELINAIEKFMEDGDPEASSPA
jgi:hypothetical protein